MNCAKGAVRTSMTRISDPDLTVWTIGHSVRAWPDFLSLLKAHGIRRLADVRRYPSSKRAPWSNRGALEAALRPEGIAYEHVEDLGGFRRPRSDSANVGLRSAGFRGYADHTATPTFRTALEGLLRCARDVRIAVMCAEAVPWRCHRSILSDALVARGSLVVHILGPGQVREHRPISMAVIRGPEITYPGLAPKRLKRVRP